MKKEIDFLYNIMDYDPDDKMFEASFLGIFPIIYSTLAVFGPLSGEKFVMKLPYFLYMIFYVFSTKSYFLRGRKLKQNFKRIGIKGQKEIEKIINAKEKTDEIIKTNIEKNPKISYEQKLDLFRKSFIKILGEEKEEIKTKELKLQKENSRIKKINKIPLVKRFEISINDSIALVIMAYLGILAGNIWLQFSLLAFCFVFCFYVISPAFRIFRFLKKNNIKVGFIEFDRILDYIKDIKEDATVNGHFYKKVYYKKVGRFIKKYKNFKEYFSKIEEAKKIDEQENIKSFDEINEMLELDNGKVLNLEKED